eukprot:TRINITY_DN100857_c0_g1_i1.p1 TRINITY_DN100857_c0_g1~~TRINITY_DN100857_c0_g1_i1.p1  ORF type:complete len:252 (+),score=19.07 TRINITY_DN100857_c0_g1_i1:150-905(+)
MQEPDAWLLGHVSRNGRHLRYEAPTAQSGYVELDVFEGDPAKLPGSDSGAVLWEGAEVLAKYVSLRGTADLIAAGGKALELGCGCALGAMVLASLGVETLATDGQPAIAYGVAAANVAANADTLSAPVHTRVLQWEDIQNEEAFRDTVLLPLGGQPPALVIGADLLYDDDGNKALACVLTQLAKARSPHDFRVLLSWQVRHEDREQAFLRSLGHTLEFVQVHEESGLDLFSDTSVSPVRVVELRPHAAVDG